MTGQLVALLNYMNFEVFESPDLSFSFHKSFAALLVGLAPLIYLHPAIAQDSEFQPDLNEQLSFCIEVTNVEGETNTHCHGDRDSEAYHKAVEGNICARGLNDTLFGERRPRDKGTIERILSRRFRWRQIFDQEIPRAQGNRGSFVPTQTLIASERRTPFRVTLKYTEVDTSDYTTSEISELSASTVLHSNLGVDAHRESLARPRSCDYTDLFRTMAYYMHNELEVAESINLNEWQAHSNHARPSDTLSGSNQVR